MCVTISFTIAVLPILSAQFVLCHPSFPLFKELVEVFDNILDEGNMDGWEQIEQVLAELIVLKWFTSWAVK